jgi:uncharacterized protein (DUF2249 family)
VIRADDRVSRVLAADPALLEVFVRVSPAFERLRNPALRRVMTRLVTVEQAARIGGVEPALLLAHLNGQAGGVPATNTGATTMDTTPHNAASRPAGLARIPDDLVVELDVRAELRAGREPFSLIMDAVRSVPPGGALALRAIFEPAPLYDVLGRRGFDHWTDRRADDDWVVWFFAAPPATDAGDAGDSIDSGDADASGHPGPADDSGYPDDGDVVVLDVRGLEPPEPMVQTLAALETLPEGATLVQLNVRVPQFLIPLLTERGFQYEVREQGPDLVRLFIRRTGA